MTYMQKGATTQTNYITRNGQRVWRTTYGYADTSISQEIYKTDNKPPQLNAILLRYYHSITLLIHGGLYGDMHAAAIGVARGQMICRL